MSQELIVFEELNMSSLYFDDKIDDTEMDKLLERIRVIASDFIPDLKTAKGRKEIASIAAKVSKCKTYLDGGGKDIVDDLKKQPKIIDAKRKKMREFLDDLKTNVREPLTKWEEAEAKRIAALEDNIREIIAAGERAKDNWNSIDLEPMIDRLQELKDEAAGDYDWEEFAAAAEGALEQAIGFTADAIEKKKIALAEQAELDAFRADKEKREREEAARAALEEERKFNEEKAAQEEKRIKDETEAAARAAVDEANREKQAAIDAKDRAEIQAKEAEKRAFREIEEKQRKEQAEIAAREADTKHRGKINREAVAALVKVGLDKGQATDAIKAIASKMIPNVKINY